MFEVLTQHLRETPVPPSVRSGRAVPPDLEAVVMRCLAKDPADRFATARDLGQALRACSRTSPWPLEEASAWWERFQPSREREPRAEAPIAGRPEVPVEIAERDRDRGT